MLMFAQVHEAITHSPAVTSAQCQGAGLMEVTPQSLSRSESHIGTEPGVWMMTGKRFAHTPSSVWWEESQACSQRPWFEVQLENWDG